MTLIATDTLGSAAEVDFHQFPPGAHLVQMYRSGDALVTALADFICAGLDAGEGVVCLATPDHLTAAGDACRARGVDLVTAAVEDRYVALDAADVLSRFMSAAGPDEYVFDAVLSALLRRAGRGGRRVRAFGEMVVLLWNDGRREATVALERMWHRACQDKKLSLFCAYPADGFAPGDAAYVNRICACHNQVAAG